MSRRNAFTAGALVLIAATLVYYEQLWQPGNAIALRPDDEDAVQRGSAIYAAYCASCHGVNLEGQPGWRQRNADGKLPAPPHDVSGHTWHHPDALLFDLTKRGPGIVVGDGYASDMPAYAEVLSDAEIIAVLSFIKRSWPEDVRRQHDLINERSR